MPPRKILIVASRPNSEALVVRVVLAHPRVAFYPCTCGLSGGAATIAVALISYNVMEVAAEMSTRRRRS
jgi:hypothetical protein